MLNFNILIYPSDILRALTWYFLIWCRKWKCMVWSWHLPSNNNDSERASFLIVTWWTGGKTGDYVDPTWMHIKSHPLILLGCQVNPTTNVQILDILVSRSCWLRIFITLFLPIEICGLPFLSWFESPPQLHQICYCAGN